MNLSSLTEAHSLDPCSVDLVGFDSAHDGRCAGCELIE